MRNLRCLESVQYIQSCGLSIVLFDAVRRAQRYLLIIMVAAAIVLARRPHKPLRVIGITEH